MNRLTNWLKARRQWKEKKAFNDKIKEARDEHAKWQAHFNRLKYESEPIRGFISDIKYINIDELAKNPYSDGSIVDMVFWIHFRFENGVEQTLQYYQKPGHTNCDHQRRILEFSGHPSILEYCSVGSFVLGYFKHGELVALDNIPHRPQPEFTDQLQPA